MNELASATEVAKVITIISHGVGKGKDITNGVVIHTVNTIEGIGKQGFVLTPGGYVGSEKQEEDGEPFTEKYPRLLAELEECFEEGELFTAAVRAKLREVGSNG